MVRLLVLGMVLGCSRSPEATISQLIEAFDEQDFDRVRALGVSPEQLTQPVRCARGTKDDLLTPAGRRRRLDAMVEHAKGHRYRVTLDPKHPIEPYYPNEWRSFQPGDVVYEDCRALVAFERKSYRIVLLIHAGAGSEAHSTKPIEVWRVGKKYYAWEDPLDTEHLD